MRATSPSVALLCAFFVSACGGAGVSNGGRMALPAEPALGQDAGGFTTLYRFRGGINGRRPEAGLVSIGGLFYGTTFFGGDSSCGCGTVFSVDASGRQTVLYRFRGASDGAFPAGKLVYSNGIFYGTTTAGGGTAQECPANYAPGCGTVFQIDAKGRESVVYSFLGQKRGQNPQGDLVALNGKIYGTTFSGGSGRCHCGTVFLADPATGGGKTLYSFRGGQDGADPMSGLTDINGVLYGTAGGRNFDDKQRGSVFTVSPSGQLTILHTFKGSDGAYPESNPVEVNGTLYGTTYYGGSGCVLNGCGTIYSIDASGNERLIWLFGEGYQDGVYPNGDLAVVKGQIYGATQEGGNAQCSDNYGCGTLFRFDPSSGREQAVHRFVPAEGAWPLGLIVHDSALYGAANQEARASNGSVFSFKP